MTRRTLPCVNYLKITTAKNGMCLHVIDIILIGFGFLRGFQIRDQNRHASPSASPAKNINLMHVTQNRSKRLKMSQGSLPHTHNLNLRLETQLAKNRKFLHVARKSVIEPIIMHGPSLYAQNCSIFSTVSLQHFLLKSRETCST
jgi:hypothetical protein